MGSYVDPDFASFGDGGVWIHVWSSPPESSPPPRSAPRGLPSRSPSDGPPPPTSHAISWVSKAICPALGFQWRFPKEVWWLWQPWLPGYGHHHHHHHHEH